MKTSFTCLLVLLCSALFAQPGAPDSSFGINGITYVGAGYLGTKYGKKLVRPLPDGKIIVAFLGNFTDGTLQQDFAVYRLNANGSPDYSFGTNGKTYIPFEGERPNQPHTDDYVNALDIQADGKIVLAGAIYVNDTKKHNTYDIGVARLNANGTIDSTFDQNGKKQIDLSRYSSPGSTCSNTDYCTGVVVTGNGHIMLSGYTTNCSGSVTGYDAFVIQLNPNGSPVKSFGNGGVQIFSTPDTDEFISGSVLQGNNKLLLIGTRGPLGANSSYSDVLLERVNAKGNLDSTFNGTGYTVTDIDNGSTDDASAGAIAVLPDGNIIAAATGNNSIYLLRYNANGKTDATFGENGKIRVESATTLASLSLAPDGKIILTASDFSVYRCLPDGIRDNGFGTNGYTKVNVWTGSTCTGSAVQADGKILAVGTAYIYVPKSQSYFNEIVARVQSSVQATANRSAVVTKASISSNELNVRVYSNPSHDHFRIRVLTNNTADEINLKVVDLSGKVMEVMPGVQAGGVTELGANYPSGTYIIDVIQGNSHKAVRVMKL